MATRKRTKTGVKGAAVGTPFDEQQKRQGGSPAGTSCGLRITVIVQNADDDREDEPGTGADHQPPRDPLREDGEEQVAKLCLPASVRLVSSGGGKPRLIFSTTIEG